ncbi:MAG: YIP1 family protein [Actinomycetota bacterium]|nr:YIP1 family protein [Actinomycetota bacterium]
MAALTGGAELLRLDRLTWFKYERTGSLASAALVTIGAYAVFAFDRFGFPALFQPRPSVRLILTGFYGWLWLATAAWAIGRYLLDQDSSFALVVRLYGFAHLPLVVVAVTIQFTSMLLQILGPAMVTALFAAVFWMPALLVAATRQAFDVDTRRAMVLVAGPYAVWLLVVGRTLTTQLGHLL